MNNSNNFKNQKYVQHFTDPSICKNILMSYMSNPRESNNKNLYLKFKQFCKEKYHGEMEEKAINDFCKIITKSNF